MINVRNRLIIATLSSLVSGAANAQTLGNPTYQTLNVLGSTTLSGNTIANVITSSSPTNSMVFKNGPNGPVMLKMGGSNGDIEPGTDIVLSGGTWGSGVLVNNTAPIFQNATFSGTTSSSVASFGAFLQQTDNSANTNSNGGVGVGVFEGLTLNGSGVVGAREAGQFTLDINATTGNTSPQDYVGLGMKCNLDATDATTGSSCFGSNPVASIGAGVTAMEVVGEEVDTFIQAGANVTDRIGMQIVDVISSTYGTQATRDDVALSLNNQYGPSSTLGFKVGFEFGRTGGSFPVATNGTLIYGQGLAGTTFTVANGVDLHLGTFTGNSWNDGHIQMLGAGDFLSNSATTLATTATTGFIHFPHTSGVPTGIPTTISGDACSINTATQTLNCYIGSQYYHITMTSGAN